MEKMLCDYQDGSCWSEAYSKEELVIEYVFSIIKTTLESCESLKYQVSVVSLLNKKLNAVAGTPRQASRLQSGQDGS